jgi:hypothetical protein
MCQAACLGNARPNASQVIDTNNCAAKCDQGDGSAAAATAFARCVDGCINSLFPSSQTAFAPGAAQASSVKAGASAATGSAKPTGSAGKFRWIDDYIIFEQNLIPYFRRSAIRIILWFCC